MARLIIALGLALRICLLFWGEYQDANSIVKYTDIDYTVFTDASKHLSQGSSPYKSIGYRYTPLLAYILLPNIAFFAQFGKLLFVACDILSGILIVLMLQENPSDSLGITADTEPVKEKISPNSIKFSVLSSNSVWLSSIWLLNPIIATISTRGSSESIMSFLVLLTFYLLKRRQLIASAIVFGLSVHFKIYPIIYAIPIWLHIDKTSAPLNMRSSWNDLRLNLFTWKRVWFGLISATVFLSLNFFYYLKFGQEFLQETFLYHVTRKDHRHNFSIYFYHIYLSFTSKTDITRLTAFLPQIGSVVYLGCVYAQQDLILAAFLQTFAFVMMNKYFVWWLCLLPMVLQKSRLVGDKWMTGCVMVLAWIASQGVWLFLAYELEFLGLNRYMQLFAAGALFFCVQLWMLVQITKWRVTEKILKVE